MTQYRSATVADRERTIEREFREWRALAEAETRPAVRAEMLRLADLQETDWAKRSAAPCRGRTRRRRRR